METPSPTPSDSLVSFQFALGELVGTVKALSDNTDRARSDAKESAQKLYTALEAQAESTARALDALSNRIAPLEQAKWTILGIAAGSGAVSGVLVPILWNILTKGTPQ